MSNSCYKFIEDEVEKGHFSEKELSIFDEVIASLKKEFYDADEFDEVLQDVSKMFIEKRHIELVDQMSNKFFNIKSEKILKNGTPKEIMNYFSYISGIKGDGAGIGQQANRMSILESVRPSTIDSISRSMKKAGLHQDFLLMRSGTKYGKYLDESVDYIRRGGKSDDVTANRLAKFMDTLDNEQIHRMSKNGIRINAEANYGSAQVHIKERMLTYESETGKSWINLMKESFQNPYTGKGSNESFDFLLQKMYKDILNDQTSKGSFKINYKERVLKPLSPDKSYSYSRIMGYQGAYNNFVTNQVDKNFKLESFNSFGSGGLDNVEAVMDKMVKKLTELGDVRNAKSLESGRFRKKWNAIKEIFKPADYIDPSRLLVKGTNTIKSLTNVKFLSNAVFVEYAAAIGNAYPLHRSLGQPHWKAFSETVNQMKDPLIALFSGKDGDKIYGAAKDYLNLSVLSSDVGSSSFLYNTSKATDRTFSYAKKLEDTFHKYNGLDKVTLHNKVKGGFLAHDSLLRAIDGKVNNATAGMDLVDGGKVANLFEIFGIGASELSVIKKYYKKHKDLSIPNMNKAGVPREVVEKVNSFYQKYSSILSASGNFSSHVNIGNIGPIKLSGPAKYLINNLGTQYLSIGYEASRNFNFLVNVLNKAERPLNTSFLKEGFATLSNATDLGGIKALAVVGGSTTMAFYLKGRLKNFFDGTDGDGFEKDMSKAFFFSDALNPLYQDMVYSFMNSNAENLGIKTATNVASFPTLSYINSNIDSFDQGKGLDNAVQNFVPFANQFYTRYARKKFTEMATKSIGFKDDWE